MSVEAITWALKQPVQQSSTKFVLVVLANCASAATAVAFPSIAYLCEATGQNRKTVIAAMQRLTLAGFIVDSGQRYGSTKQIIGYRLRMEVQRDGDLLTERHYCYRSEESTSGRYYVGVRSCLGETTSDAGYIGSGRWIQACKANGAETVKSILSVFTSRVAAEDAERSLIAAAIGDPLCMNRVVPPKRTENGTVANSTENGTAQTVPNSDGKGSEKGAEQSQKRDTEPSLTVKKQTAGAATRGTRLPNDWMPNDEGKAYATEQRVDWKIERENFRDYWIAVAGAKGLKLDWDATWRTWTRRAPKSLTAPAAPSVARKPASPSESPFEAAMIHARRQHSLGQLDADAFAKETQRIAAKYRGEPAHA